MKLLIEIVSVELGDDLFVRQDTETKGFQGVWGQMLLEITEHSTCAITSFSIPFSVC